MITKETIKNLPKQHLGIAEFKVCEELFGGGVVVDGRESLLFLDLALPYGPDMAMWSAHELITCISMIYFQHLWNNAEEYKH